MKDGLTIDDPGTGYDESGFTEVVNPCNDRKRTDKNIFTMYADREPRFYAAVTYEGKSWHIQPRFNYDWGAGFAKGKEATTRLAIILETDICFISSRIVRLCTLVIISRNGHVRPSCSVWRIFIFIMRKSAMKLIPKTNVLLIIWIRYASVPGYLDIVSWQPPGKEYHRRPEITTQGYSTRAQGRAFC